VGYYPCQLTNSTDVSKGHRTSIFRV